MHAAHGSWIRSLSSALSVALLLACEMGRTQASSAEDAVAAEKATQKIIRVPTEGFVWPNQRPKDCPFEQSKQFGGVYFTGAHHGRWYGDTWYPSWASDGNLYSPWTDGTTEGVTSVSIENDTDWKIATTGNAVMIGDDPENLTIKNTSPPQRASPKPFEGRYPCGSLIYNGVWYYGTYCLGPKPTTKHEGFDYNWPILGRCPASAFRPTTARPGPPRRSRRRSRSSPSRPSMGRGKDGRPTSSISARTCSIPPTARPICSAWARKTAIRSRATPI